MCVGACAGKFTKFELALVNLTGAVVEVAIAMKLSVLKLTQVEAAPGLIIALPMKLTILELALVDRATGQFIAAVSVESVISKPSYVDRTVPYR